MTENEAWVRAIIEVAQCEALHDGLIDERGNVV